jgi:hypothetical protein
MIECRAKQRAALQATRKLSGELLHAANRRQLRHVFAQHVKVFEQHGALIFERWLERFASLHRVFNLPKDPGVGHRAAPNQDTVTSCVAKPIEGLLNRSYVAAAGNGHAYNFLNLFHQFPVRQSAIALFFRASM